MSTLLIIALVIGVAVATYLVLLYTGKIKDRDGDFIPDVVEDTVEDIKEEIEEIEEFIESIPTITELKKMTKAKLEELGREHGIELDKRKTKSNMIADLVEKTEETQ